MSRSEKLIYQPSDTPVPILLDTDIGPDCDDAGAVAVLHALEKSGRARIVGMTHCTASRWGAGCLDALNVYYGRGDIPVGTLRRLPGFLDDDDVFGKYNKLVAQQYPNRYEHGEMAPDATELTRELLAAAEDGSIVFVAIGPLVNFMHLLQSEPDRHSDLNGRELVARKAKHLVIMGGLFPEGKEWNFEMHPQAAAYVTKHWPTDITFTGYEIGAEIRTGRRLHIDAPADHPVRRSYNAWYGGEGGIRESWDLTAVLYAAEGAADYWDIVRGTIEVDAESGANCWLPDTDGRHAYLSRKMDPEKLTELLDELLVRY